jgi:uncharacterized membrane-anchored protein YjiN (DUF445 family)
MRKFTFELSEEAYQLLLSIKKEGYAEYRDPRYENLEEFKNDIDNYISVDSFLDRNHNGTYYLISELLKYNLVDTSDDSWHITYILTDFGKELVSDASLREDKINKILEK